MKFPSLLFAGLTLVSVSSHAQQGPGPRGGGRDREAAVPEAPLPQIPLTPQQVELISKQLADLEKQIEEMRGSTLGAVMQKLRSAVASDAAALGLLLDSEKLVNVERKDLDKTEERQRKEQMDRNAERRNDKKAEDQDGDMGIAARLHIQYMILTLEARETKVADRDNLLPKLTAFIQDVVANADKLKGRAGQFLNRDVGGSVIAQAFQIERFLQGGGDWASRPLDFGGIWDRFILPHTKEQKPDGLGAQYDNRISAETALRKGMMPEPEFIIWGQQELPEMKWQRANYLLRNGPAPLNALKDMLDHIKAHPGHPSAPGWLAEMRTAMEAGAGAAAPAVQ
jgi:hypothetical protein